MILSQSQLKTLSSKLSDRIPEILSLFSIEYTDQGDRYTFCCPIHKGDNLNGACIYKESGIFKCWTESCDKDAGKGILGFIQLLGGTYLSGPKEFSFPEAIKWSADFVGEKLEKMEIIDHVVEDVYKQNKLLEIFNKKPMVQTEKISRESVLRYLNIPSEYFINRGFSKDVLVKFDIGESTQSGKLMSGRAVVPIYDINGQYAGCTGRIRTEDSSTIKKYQKWLNSKGFSKSMYLYGIHVALEHIVRTRNVFLVEGPGDVWRMHEAGFYNSVAILGASLSEYQLTILENIIIDNLFICTDNDEAGLAAYNQIVKKCGRRFNYHRLTTDKKDIGATEISTLHKLFHKYK